MTPRGYGVKSNLLIWCICVVKLLIVGTGCPKLGELFKEILTSESVQRIERKNKVSHVSSAVSDFCTSPHKNVLSCVVQQNHLTVS